jgi:FtsP/CotA-like multicopper oxidase with cupredoxin domain
MVRLPSTYLQYRVLANISGIVRPVLVFNGQFPGPLIEANRGDRILVNVTNNLVNATTV